MYPSPTPNLPLSLESSPTPNLPSLLQTLAAPGGGDARFTGACSRPPRASPRLSWDRDPPHARADFTPPSPAAFGAGPSRLEQHLADRSPPPFAAVPPSLRAPSRSAPALPSLPDQGAESGAPHPRSRREEGGARSALGPDYVSQEPPRRLAEGFWARVTAAALVRGTAARDGKCARLARCAGLGPGRREGACGETAGPVRAGSARHLPRPGSQRGAGAAGAVTGSLPSRLPGSPPVRAGVPGRR